MQRIRTALPVLACALGAAVFSPITSAAQNTNSADVTGTVTDPKGAVIVGATIIVNDIDKDTEHTVTTDKAGVYDTGSIVPDHYLITISAPGFKSLVRGPVNLDVGVHGFNAELTVGATTEEMTVTSDLPLLDVEDGSRTENLDGKTMAALPQYGADWQNFVDLLPGASYSFRTGQATSINGNLPYSSVLADGATTTLPMSTNSDVTVFETTQEVKVDANAFSAQYGIGGIIFNQITKGGTDKFHGSAYEYLQNDDFNAADYAFGHGGHPAFQRYDNYGFSVGGPIVIPHLIPKDKVFFYFDFDKTYSNGGSGNQVFTVPTDAEKMGDFTGLPTVFDYTSQALTYNTQGQPSVVRKSFASEFGAGNKIPTNMLSPLAQNVQKYYPEPNTPGTPTGKGLPHNNYFINVPNQQPFTKYFGRLDYTPVPSHRLTISDTTSDNPAVSYGNGETLCPINCQHQDVSRDNAQISDVWTISPHMINEARFGFTDQLNFFTPFSAGEGYPNKLGIKWAVVDAFPNFDFNNYLSFGSPTNAVYKEMLFDPSDVVTLIAGKHVLHFGGEFLISRADSTAWGNENPGSVDFQGYYTDVALNNQKGLNLVDPQDCGANDVAQSCDPTDYADFLTGYSADWYGNVNPEWGGRLKNPQLFIQDDLKLKPNLTVNLGLRWAGMTGWKEVKGNQATFDPTVINPGTDPNGHTNTYGGEWFAFSHANGRNSLQAPVWNTFMPRLGFAYQYRPNTVIRGGIGLYNYTWSEDTYGGGMGSAFGSAGGQFDNSGGIYPVLLIDSDGSVDYQGGYGQSKKQLYVSAPTTPNAENGQSISYNPYHTPVPKIWQYNLTVQREIGNSMMISAAYVGSHGYNLNFPVDFNQVPQGQLSVTDTAPGNNQRPYPNYFSLGGSSNNGISNYNSFQFVFQRRLTHGLELNANYTYSKFLDSQDSSGWGSSAGSQTYQSSYCVPCNYGPSNFDERHVFTFSGIYTLPFGRGQQFLNRSAWLDEAVGGWKLSATSRENTGAPFTPVMANNQTYAQAGSQFPNLVGNPLSVVAPGNNNDPTKLNGGTQTSTHTIQNWFNKYAYAAPAQLTFGNVHRNSLYGPDYSDLSLSFGKTFKVLERYELTVKADARNVLNHPAFGTPDSAIDDTLPAQITYVVNNGRHIQLYAHFQF